MKHTQIKTGSQASPYDPFPHVSPPRQSSGFRPGRWRRLHGTEFVKGKTFEVLIAEEVPLGHGWGLTGNLNNAIIPIKRNGTQVYA